MSGSEKKKTLTTWADFADSVEKDFWKHDSKDCPGNEEGEGEGEGGVCKLTLSDCIYERCPFVFWARRQIR